MLLTTMPHALTSDESNSRPLIIHLVAVVQIKIGSLGLSTDAASAAFILDFIGMTKNEDFTVKRLNKGRFLSALFGQTVSNFGD